MNIFIAIGIGLISYFIGGFSTCIVLAKSFKSLNLYKVGTGHPDTENMFQNVSKSLGLLAGAIDFLKVYLYLMLLNVIFREFFSDINYGNYLLIYGFLMLLGHCLPANHKFKGGRGLFTYIGLIAYFAFLPTVIVAIMAGIVVIFFKQIRFAQYMIVLLPSIIAHFCITLFPSYFSDYNSIFLTKLLIVAFLMGVVNIVVSKNLGEI
jgi:glycerol-3-phosphate acyltransferase PlsY